MKFPDSEKSVPINYIKFEAAFAIPASMKLLRNIAAGFFAQIR